MKKTIALIMMLFFVGIGTANEKINEIHNSNDSTLVCWGINYSVNTLTDVITYSGSPGVIMLGGDYIHIEIRDLCGNLVYQLHKTSGSNSGTISKTLFNNGLCIADQYGNQNYKIDIEWKSFGCGISTGGGLIYL